MTKNCLVSTLGMLKLNGMGLSYAIYEPPYDKTKKMACEPSEETDQPGHSPSLIRVFADHLKKAGSLSYPISTQRRL